VIEGDVTHKDTGIILGDPARILAALQEADTDKGTETDNRSLSHLKWAQSTFAGVNVVVQNHSRDDFVLTRTSGFGPQMAEYCMGWALFVSQRVEGAQQQQREKEWNIDLFTHRGSLHCKTIGILGVGDIGSAVAYGARAFHMKTLGLCSSLASAEANNDKNFDMVIKWNEAM
jgi:phosphoglycerate dehydrogenase-like enzyme